MALDPAQWSYLAEGKLHVVVAFEGPENADAKTTARFRHHVLRLLKERHPDAASGPSSLYDAARERAYLERVLEPLLAPYLELGSEVLVTRAFLQGVASRIAPARPKGRTKYGLDLGAATAECLRDLTRYFPALPRGLAPLGSAGMAGTLTMEIKPKAGFLSRSYLVAPEHRALKRRLSRFQIMQRYRFQLKLTEAVEPEWGVLRWINLDYSPLDFFSGDVGRCAGAIRSLLRNPQNFCQLFLDGQPLYGRGLEDLAAAEQAVAQLLLRQPPTSTTTAAPRVAQPQQEEEEGRGPFDALADLLARLLAQEPLLARLWALQAMDVLDVEGAGLVLQRLIALCGGEEANALARLATAELEPLAVVAVDPRLVALEGTLARAVAKGEECVERADELEEAAVWQAQHERARAAVAGLSEDECVWLLRRWLVSLGACDASIMVSMRRCQGEEAIEFEPQLQAAETAGVVRFEGGGGVAYCAHVVDLGPKDPAKVVSKSVIEPGLMALAGLPMPTPAP